MFEEKGSVLFEDIGSKLKATAIILFGLGVVGAVIIGVCVMLQFENVMRGLLAGVICVAALGLCCWVGSVCLYALGEITHHLEDISVRSGKIANSCAGESGSKSEPAGTTSAVKSVFSGNGMVVCGKCGKYQLADKPVCSKCGFKL